MTSQPDASFLALLVVWTSTGLALLSDNIHQIIGAGTGITGALMLALKYKHAAWTWPVWLASNVAWICYGLSTGGYGLVLEHAVFGTINLFGTWIWLVKPHIARMKTQYTGQPAL